MVKAETAEALAKAEGRPVDARSDIFSFGCVLHEMLTGCRAFPGDSQAAVISVTAGSISPGLSWKSMGRNKRSVTLNLGKPKGAKSNLHRWMNRQPDNNSQPKLDI